MKRSASIYEFSGSQFFRTTTGIQSGSDPFNKPRFIMGCYRNIMGCYRIILGVVEILCSFRLVLGGKIGKEIPESSRLMFLEKFSGKHFALSDPEDNTFRPLNRGGIADSPLLRTLLTIPQKFREPNFLGSDWLFCFISICKFGSFKNPFVTITSLSEL